MECWRNRSKKPHRKCCLATKKTDRTRIARYILGVGTASNKVLRAIDGAISFGVPANVRKLYRFLCWNWQPGDSIMLFGFSRGAFTVRTLAGMIAHQGLMPRERNGRQVTTAGVRSNASGAWWACRAASSPWVLPTATLLRWLQNGTVAVKRGLSGQEPHRVLTEPAFPTQPDKGVRVDFLGVFDTVEAFGMPVEELRRIISRALYPLSFSNGICAPSILCARHALAVDEERLSFRNVSFEVPKDGNGQPARPWQDVGQSWFPGVHSDIGGGYPDDHGSDLLLTWMLDEAEKTNAVVPGRGLLEGGGEAAAGGSGMGLCRDRADAGCGGAARQSGAAGIWHPCQHALPAERRDRTGGKRHPHASLRPRRALCGNRHPDARRPAPCHPPSIGTWLSRCPYCRAVSTPTIPARRRSPSQERNKVGRGKPPDGGKAW